MKEKRRRVKSLAEKYRMFYQEKRKLCRKIRDEHQGGKSGNFAGK